MDPNLIHLDWERAGEALALVVVFSFIVERALAIDFENRIWIRNVQVDGLKEIIVLFVPIVAFVVWNSKAFVAFPQTGCGAISLPLKRPPRTWAFSTSTMKTRSTTST